jgi:cytosine/adenosine deaminase-related metal-dependent hydrolase
MISMPPEQMVGGSLNQAVIHRAPWLVTAVPEKKCLPVAFDIRDKNFLIEDGAVCVSGGRIGDVGRFADVQRRFQSVQVVDHPASILAPSLVNAHTHLELSYLGSIRAESGAPQSFTDWIRVLIDRRQSVASGERNIIDAGRRMLRKLYASGIGALADIGNRNESLDIGLAGKPEVFFFLELIGMTAEGTERCLDLLGRNSAERRIAYTAHAPYSCSAKLLQRVKNHAASSGRLFPIHTAESEAEIEFLRCGTGEIRDFLQERGSWDESFAPMRDNRSGAIDYLHALGLLDERTLCVHVVHISSKEIETLARKGVKVCLCPGSNRFLGVGCPPAEELLKNGILPGIGTDSIASNQELDMWREMEILHEEHPAIPPAAIFAMATRGGAEALGYQGCHGVLHPGAAASIIAIDAEDVARDTVFDYLVTRGGKARVSWAAEAKQEQVR